MACAALVELVTDYLESALGPPERRRFEAHLEQCSGCRDHLEQMRRTVATVGRLEPPALPEPLREKLLAAFCDWRAA